MSYEKPRIGLNDTMMLALQKMAGGNPGAITVMMEMVKESPKIDPQRLMGGLGPILSLDSEDIYEERIWMLYKDLCGQDIVKTLACLRASQLGIITTTQLSKSINGQDKSFNADDILKKVKERLEDFDKEEKVESETNTMPATQI